MTLEELSDHTHNGMMNHALHSVSALFEADGWGPCDSIKAANELLKPAWDAWSTLMERVTNDAARIAQLEAALAEALERLHKVLVVCDHWVAYGCDCDACNELTDAIDAARKEKP